MSEESTYQPPYTFTSEILTRVAQISEAMGRLNVLTDRARELRLRRITMPSLLDCRLINPTSSSVKPDGL